MALPIVPIALGAAALFLLTQSSKGAQYSQAPSDGSKPPVKENAPPAKGWQEMPAALQEQVATALGELGVSPATGQLSGGAVSADAIKLATQTAALCESQGFYEVAKQLRGYAEQAARAVPTPASAKPVVDAAPPGLSPAEKEAVARTIALERDPKVLIALRERLAKLPKSAERDNFLQMLDALILQLQAAQSTTQTLQQIDQVIKSPGIAEVHAAVQPLPPAPIPVMPMPPAPPPAPPPKPAVVQPPVAPPTIAPPAPSVVVPVVTSAVQTLTYAALLPLTGTRVLQSGSKGEDVRAWQNILRLDGYGGTVAADGVYGAKTVAATKAWQKQRGLTADGKVGAKTRAAVGRPSTAPAASPAAAPVANAALPPLPAANQLVFAAIQDPTPSAKTLTQANATKAEATSWQNILTALGYGSIVGKVDGVWGAKTTAATRALQTYAASKYRDTKPIGVDGAVGPQTRRIVIARTAELKSGTTIAGSYAA